MNVHSNAEWNKTRKRVTGHIPLLHGIQVAAADSRSGELHGFLSCPVEIANYGGG